MLRCLRRSSRLMVPFALAIVAMVVVGQMDWWHADDEDSAAPIFHDHAAHHPLLRSPISTPSRAPEHCYLCHWLRTLHGGLRTASIQQVPSPQGRQLQDFRNSATCDLAATLRPARAPPA